MGHDICIKLAECTARTTYITGNFSRFNPRIHQLHGHPGKVIAPFLERKLARLRKRGIVPNSDLGVDGWGQYIKDSPLLQFAKKRAHVEQKGEPFTNSWADYEDGVKEVMHAVQCMHAYHMDRFLQLAREYPEAYWYSDQVWSIEILDGDVGKPDEESDDESEDDPVPIIKTEPGFVVPMDKVHLLQGLYGIKSDDGVVYSYMHPLNGVKTIQTWEDAMDAARNAVTKGDERAISWTILALIIKGN